MKKSFVSELSWLFKLEEIRKKIHENANIPMLHVNEEEAKKMLARIKQEQDLIIEKAVKEEQEEKQK